MINNARGKHSSPGVYIEEIDKSYANKSLGVTTLGIVGETLKGPAFEPIRISDWAEFQEYFGGTSTKKFKGNGYPQYEAAYIAKSYLTESKQLEMCRVLGFSGYNAGDAWVIYGTNNNTEEKYIIGVLRSKGVFNAQETGNVCEVTEKDRDSISFTVTDINFEKATSIEGTLAGCNENNEGEELENGDFEVKDGKYGKFTLVITTNKKIEVIQTRQSDTSSNNPDDNTSAPGDDTNPDIEPDNETGTETKEEYVTEKVVVSLYPGDKDYIVNVLGMSAQEGNYSVFVEELYDLAHIKACKENVYNSIGIEKITSGMSNYKESFRSAMTPWFVSELKGSGLEVEVKKLFRFHTISDGNAANSQIKISIANILPDEGLFDVLIRDYHDTDNSQLVLERFTKCNMVPGTSNYIGLKIGTFDGEYSNKSKYVTVEVIENETTETCVPCGFLGYPTRSIEGYKSLDITYNTEVYENIKLNRQYFGMSDLKGVDLDVLTYKGKNAYHSDYKMGYSKGFHLDTFINANINETINCKVDGVSGFEFVTPLDTVGRTMDATKIPHIGSEAVMKYNIYSDIRLRKFTCYPYGGFDGWDIYREERTNTNEYRANKYKGYIDENNQGADSSFTTVFPGADYGLSGKMISSDYYAYLAGYKQFENPNKVKINILTTPGIDYVHNLDLFNEVLDIVEESRQGDCIYIATTPDHEFVNGVKVEIDADGAVSNLIASEISTSYAATYYPWVKYYDSTNKKYINLPVTKDVVRNFAHTDNVAHPWYASAGMSRGNVECDKACRYTKNDDEDLLYENMINPVKTFSSDGVKLWGNKTMYQEDTPLNRINVRRLMIRIKDLVLTASQQLIFEQNDNMIDAQFHSIVNPILANAKQNRGISDYKIITDTSAEARDRKELPAKIWVKPINCLEYIPISFIITPEGTNFED